MSNKEREFRELKKLVTEGCFYYSESEMGYNEESTAQAIQDAGYRKFPIEELESWLEEMKNANPITHPDGCPYPHNTIDFFDDVLAKIKELKNEG